MWDVSCSILQYLPAIKRYLMILKFDGQQERILCVYCRSESWDLAALSRRQRWKRLHSEVVIICYSSDNNGVVKWRLRFTGLVECTAVKRMWSVLAIRILCWTTVPGRKDNSALNMDHVLVLRAWTETSSDQLWTDCLGELRSY
jgi:hypothetical protein